MTDLLNRISSPADLKLLSRAQLIELSHELRAFILESVSKTGGHLSSNLGTVELTIALHHVFNTPDDRLIWDVGHQSYAHKILTGRRADMAYIRKAGHISGFPRRIESEYDAFGTAHSSTSISAALGMAIASAQKGVERQHIAVIGDGAMSAGMVFEALNNASETPNINLLVILNDNEMSISPPVGAFNKYLTRLTSGSFYRDARELGKSVLEYMPGPMAELARKFKGHAKSMISAGTLFEEFGFNYRGPIDGHDLNAVIPALQNLKMLGGLQFLHVVTRKGQGYELAEKDPVLYHGPGQFNLKEGIKPAADSPKAKTFTSIFSDWICDQAEADPQLMAITPAMREGSGLVDFERRFKSRYFDVGIAEQHAVTFAAGLACEGLKPVVAIYSTFLQRGYDQLIHDVALQNLDVTFALDRAGIVGADGATHGGNFDIAFLRCIPNIVLAVPSDEREMRLLLNTCYQHDGPAAVRYPRGKGVGAEAGDSLETVPLGKARILHRGSSGLAILAFGVLLQQALPLAQELDATIVDMRFVKPLDTACVHELALDHQGLITLEEGVLMGGAGSAVAEYLHGAALPVPLLQLALPDHFIDHGDRAELLSEAGLDTAGIAAAIRKRFASHLSEK